MIDAGFHAYFEEYLDETERLPDNNQRGFCKHWQGMVGLGSRKARSEQFIMDEDGTLRCAFVNGWGGSFRPS